MLWWWWESKFDTTIEFRTKGGYGATVARWGDLITAGAGYPPTKYDNAHRKHAECIK